MPVMFFGQFLVERGIIPRHTLLRAIELQESMNLSFGETAIAMGFLENKQVERIQQAQRGEDLEFGDMAVRLGILTEDQKMQVETRQKNDHLYIGEALVTIGAFNDAELRHHLDEFKAGQAPYHTDRVTIPLGVPMPEMWSMIADLSFKMITRVAHLTFRPEPCRVVNQLPKNDVITIMDFVGDLNGSYIFATSYSIQKKVAQAILGEEHVAHEPQEVLDDTVMEFANIVCGNFVAKAAQMGKMIEISPPRMLDGSEGIDVPEGEMGLLFPLLMASSGRAELALLVR